MAHYEPSHQGQHCLPNFNDRTIHCLNLGMKGLTQIVNLYQVFRVMDEGTCFSGNSKNISFMLISQR